MTQVDLLKLRDFAQRIGMSEWWVRKEIANRRIIGVRMARNSWCVPETEVDRLRTERQTELRSSVMPRSGENLSVLRQTSSNRKLKKRA